MDTVTKYYSWTATVLARKFRTFVRQPVSVVALVPIAWAMIGLASMAIAVLPSRRLMPLLGRGLGATPLVPVVTGARQKRAAHIGNAVVIAAKYAPFRSNCLPQALAAATLCRWARVPYAAFLGASPKRAEGSSGMSAHAWIQSGPISVTGGSGSFQIYGVVACFVPGSVDA